jgi:hypothetical protein
MSMSAPDTAVVPQDNSDPKNLDLIARLAGAQPVKVIQALYYQVAVTLGIQLLDPILTVMERALDSATEHIRIAKMPPEPYLFSESGESFSDKKAKAKVDHNQASINARKAAGSTIDVRVPNWLRIAGALSPWAESFGILVYVTFLWDCDWLRPWDDFMSFITALILVIFMPLLQKYCSEHAGHAHNSYRLNDLEGLDIPARADKVKRNWYLAGALFIATVVAATIVIRGLIALDMPNRWEIAVITLLAAIVGYGTAILAYAAIALDGTRYSRENDELTAQGEAFAADWEAEIEEAQQSLEKAANNERHLIEGAFPKVLENVRTQFEGDRSEDLFNLLPLVERAKRLVALRERRVALEAELETVKADYQPAFHLNS